jgi:hypothetical protein
MERHLHNACKRWTRQIDNSPQKLTKKTVAQA